MARRKPPDDDLTIHGCDDFLAEQGVADPNEFRVKSHLATKFRPSPRSGAWRPVTLFASPASRRGDRRGPPVVTRRSAVWSLIRILSALGADAIYVLPDSGRDHGIVLSETVGSDQDSLAPEPESST